MGAAGLLVPRLRSHLLKEKRSADSSHLPRFRRPRFLALFP
jgi:hypothetical protein